MAPSDWEPSYVSGDLPWDTGRPSEHLGAAFDAKAIAPGRALEVGCGTGSNTIWLAERGFDVIGVDIAPTAIARSGERADEAGVRCRFEVLDFLEEEPPGGPFDLVFDRGTFHVFEDADRARFAARVAALLADGGLWLSIIGSTEGPPRDFGPPRRSARDVVSAIEPSLELVSLQASKFEDSHDFDAAAWVCLARRRSVPAQPSARH